mgnify:CR=1 FL=1|jgi:hypothetical protein|tara:strand:+ start:1049 stop:1207 length:159 start_codon:yes stop_codon:yes gene_type:complete
MVKLQYFNGETWSDCGEFYSDRMAWVSLGDDNKNYRTVDESGSVITDPGEKS